MGKRIRRTKSISCCVSPRSSYLNPHSSFSWYEEDAWTEIAKFLDGKSLLMLALTCRWFYRILMHESIWKYACLRDLQVPDPRQVGFKWTKLYATAFDGSHSYMFRQQEKHIGTMQILDARHIELFLCDGYLEGNWDYELLGSHENKKHAAAATGGIFDIKHLNDQSTAEVFNLKSWVAKANDWQPKAIITYHAVAVNTNLQTNEGLHVKYHAMRAGKGGKIIAIRISKQLL